MCHTHWDPARRDDRDEYTCSSWSGGTFCTRQNNQLLTDLNIPPPKTLVSCDEFPFGGAEEGGDWGAKYATRKRPPTANCVPQWQQTIQGNCNGILSTLYTNVAYFD
ncbi:uncharacterized protein BDW70DRAFT_164336 [Aspergillus foveolatus]|uniref:uncharacterized protein n=1 Tax=Aspergillus foveolatus TaxID=210207 RepID=UPI003CCE1AFF